MKRGAGISDDELRGTIFTRLREAGFLPITASTPEGRIREAFGVEASRFWQAVAELEKHRELTRSAQGLNYREPRDRS